MTTTPSKNILIIDNDLALAFELSRKVKALGYAARFTNNSSEGFKLAYELAPDVIFMRLDMPGLDGYTVARILRSEPRFAATLLVAMSEQLSTVDERRIRLAGFDAVLYVPVDGPELEPILRRERTA